MNDDEEPQLDAVHKWLETEIFRYVCLHERGGGAPLSLLLSAFDPGETTIQYKRIWTERPEWLRIPSRLRHQEVRITLNKMIASGRIRTTNEDDVILYLHKMLTDKHQPEPSYVPVNVLDQMVERLDRE